MNRYMEIFHVDRAEMVRLVATGLAGGGDWCDLYFENTVFNDLMLKDSEVSSGGFHVDYGVGIRVLKGDKTGYAYSENTAPAEMLAAAKAAAVIADGGAKGRETGVSAKGAKGVCAGANGTEGVCVSKNGAKGGYMNAGSEGNSVKNSYKNGSPNCEANILKLNDFYPVVSSEGQSRVAMVSYLNKLENLIRSKDSRVVKVVAKISDSMSDILMFNSLGELTADSRPLCSLVVSVVFAQNGKMESNTSTRSFRMGLEMFTDELIEEVATEAVAGIDERFEAGRPAGGKMPVVMAAGASGILLHEAMGHAFEADFNRKGQSIFSDKMGQKICSDAVNIVDDGTIPRNRGAVNVDDEGVAGQKTYMVTGGVLTSYLHDRISAKHYGVAPTGNGRRESFRYNPIPRMRATYMESGNANPSDIIASVKKGLYVQEFANGQVKIGEGDFTFFVKSGRLIENGRLTMPIKDINVIGNGPKALEDILAVGNDMKIDNGTWTCGKEQSAAVSLGIPTVLIKSLTVGGE